MSSSRHIQTSFCVFIILFLFAALSTITAAQPAETGLDLFEFPDTTDLFFALHPDSDEGVTLVPGSGISILVVFEATPFEQVDQRKLECCRTR